MAVNKMAEPEVIQYEAFLGIYLNLPLNKHVESCLNDQTGVTTSLGTGESVGERNFFKFFTGQLAGNVSDENGKTGCRTKWLGFRRKYAIYHDKYNKYSLNMMRFVRIRVQLKFRCRNVIFNS